MNDDSLDISNSRSKSFDCQSTNKLEKFDEEITNKHLFWPSSSVCRPNEFDKISLEDSRESLIKSCLSRIKYNLKELDILEVLKYKQLLWPHLSVSKPNELDKISIEDASRYQHKLYMIKYNLEELCDLEERYLSVSKQLSNELDKISLGDSRENLRISLEDSRDILLKYCFSDISHILRRIDNELDKFDDIVKLQHILYAIKNELEILDDLNMETGEDQIQEKRRFHKNKHLSWPNLSVNKPNELDKKLLEDSRKSSIKSLISRIKYNVKKLDDLEHTRLFWPSESFSKTHELDKKLLEDLRRYQHKLNMIKFDLEKLCNLEEHYLYVSKQLSNELDKISLEDSRENLRKSLEDSRESLLKYCFSDISHILQRIDNEIEKLNDLKKNHSSASKQILNKFEKYTNVFRISLTDPRETALKSHLSKLRPILYTIKNELKELNDLNRRSEVIHKYKSEKKTRYNKFQSIFEQMYIDNTIHIDKQIFSKKQLSDDEQLSNDDQLSNDEQLSNDDQLSNDEQLSNDDQLSIDEKLLNDEQIHKDLKNNYQILINSKIKKWPSKNLFEQIENYLNSIDKNDELKQRLLDNTSINKEEKQFLNCVMTSLSILCELSDNCEYYATNILINTQIINPLLNLLERFSHNQYSHSIADQLLENIVFIFTNLSRRANNLTKANWIIYLEQCLKNKKLRELIHISAALAIAFQCDEDFQDSLNVRLLVNKGYERANANANKEWSGFSLEEFREGLDKLKL